jgi:hypothetical protein
MTRLLGRDPQTGHVCGIYFIVRHPDLIAASIPLAAYRHRGHASAPDGILRGDLLEGEASLARVGGRVAGCAG